MARVVDDGICLRRWEWSETSQTGAILARDHGLLRVIAKGARRPNAPFSGGLEPMTRAQFGAIVKGGSRGDPGGGGGGGSRGRWSGSPRGI